MLKVEKKNNKITPEKNFEEEKKVYDVYLDDADIDEASEEDDSNTEVARIEILPIEDIQKSKDEDSMDESGSIAERTFATGRNDGKRTADKIANGKKKSVEVEKRFV